MCDLPPASTISFDSDNQIDEETFLEPTEADVKKPIGIVKKIMKVQREVNLLVYGLLYTRLVNHSPDNIIC